MDDVCRMPLGPLSSAVWNVLAVMFVWVSLLLWTLETASAQQRETAVSDRCHRLLSLDADGCRVSSKIETVTFIVAAALLSERKSFCSPTSLIKTEVKEKICTFSYPSGLFTFELTTYLAILPLKYRRVVTL